MAGHCVRVGTPCIRTTVREMRYGKYKCCISLATILVLLAAQLLPCLAQTVPPHTGTPTGMPLHQHQWQSTAINSVSPTAHTHTWTAPVHQHTWQGQPPQSANNGSPSSPTHAWTAPVHQHTWQGQPPQSANNGSPSLPTHAWTTPVHQHTCPGQPMNLQSTNNVSASTHTLTGTVHQHAGTLQPTSSQSGNSSTANTHLSGNSFWHNIFAGSTTHPASHAWFAHRESSNAGSSSNNYSNSFSQRLTHDHATHLWVNAASGSGSSAQTMNLDLSSTSTTMSAGHWLHNGTVTIDVGGTSLVVNANTQLTPAEYLAVRQAVTGQEQSLVINSQGSATAGTFIINPHMSQMISSLVIPQGVTIVDLTRSGTLNLTGNITDAGSLYVTSINHALNTVTIDASNIYVLAQGLISDVLPAAIQPASALLNLNLMATNNITNAGTISSGGSLSLTAGGSITNFSLGSAISSPASGNQGATIQAAKDVNLTAGSGNITNNGLIASTSGNINIATQTPQNIVINGIAGQFSALKGAINVRDANYIGSNNINITGGNYLSQLLNLSSGTGTVTVNAGLVTGDLNINAGAAHVTANTPLLTLGKNCISGDPTYYNTGSIQIIGTVSSYEDLAIIAGDNITSDSNGQIATNGHNLLMIAGANITSSCAGCTDLGTVGPTSRGITPTDVVATGVVTVSLTGGTGGNIDLSNSTVSPVIDTRSNSGAGGNVTLVSLANGTHGGNVTTGSGDINSSGTDDGAGGNVTIYAGASSANQITSIAVGNIITNGGTSNGSSGNVTLQTAQAVTSNNAALIFNEHGDITSGNTIQPGSSLRYAGVATGRIDTRIDYSGTGSAGNVTIKAFYDIRTSTIFAHNLGTGAGGTLTVTSANGSYSAPEINTYENNGSGAAGSVIISTNGSIDLTTISGGDHCIHAFNFGTGAGGTVTLLSQSGSVSTHSIQTFVDNESGNAAAGNVTISTFGSINTHGFNIETYNNDVGSGGAVTLSSKNDSITIENILTHSGSNGYAGVVNIMAGKTISVAGIDTNSNNGISAGPITLIAGQDISIGTSGIYTVGNTNAEAIFTKAGDVNLIAQGNITVSGAINTSYVGTTGTYLCMTCNGGAVTLTARGYVHSTNIVSDAVYSDNSTPGNQGGAVTITAGADISTGEIDSWGGAGNGGAVTLTAGTNISNNGTNINSYANGNAGTGNGGAVTLSSGTFIITGQIDTDATRGYSGGAVTITSAGNAITTGSIDAAGGAANGGSVGITAAGAVVVNNITTYGVNAYAGNVFVSSGFSSAALRVGQIDTSSGVAGGAGTIFLGAANNPSGSNGFAGSNTYISYSLQSTQVVSPTPAQAYLFYNNPATNPSTITGDTTIHITTGTTGVNIYPGAYVGNIGSSVAAVNLTLDLGGDSRTIAPIVAAGNMYMASFAANNTAGGPSSYQNDGYPILLVSGGTTGILLTGTVTSNPYPSSGGNIGNIYMLSMGSGSSITQRTGALSFEANNLILRAGGGGIDAYAPYNVVVNTTGDIRMLDAININSGSYSTNGSLLLSSGSAILVTGAISTSNSGSGGGGAVDLTSAGSVTTGSIQTLVHGSSGNGGAVTITAGESITIIGNIDTDVYNGHDVHGGAVTLTADQSIIATGNIVTAGGTGGTANYGGAVTLTARGFIVTTGYIITEGFSAPGGGTVNLTAGTSINSGEIDTDAQLSYGVTGGAITLTAGTSISITSSDGTYAMLTVGGSGDGGAVTLTAGGFINTNGYEIYTAAGRSGNGGAVTITAGGNSSGCIYTGEIDTDAVYSSGIHGVNGGAVTLTCGNSILINGTGGTSGINTVGGSGNGGSVMVMAGTSIVITDGSSAAIDTHADSGSGGSVALVAGDIIRTGGISAYTASNIGNNGAGNVFVSSGSGNTGTPVPAISITSIDTSAASGSHVGHIFLGADSGSSTTDNGISSNSMSSAGAIQFSTTSGQSQTTPNPYLFYDTGSTSITLGTTIRVVYVDDSRAVNIQPGNYSAIGSPSPGLPVALTLDLGGDSRTIVPVCASGNIYLSGLNIRQYETVVGTGYTEAIVSGIAADTGIFLSGNVNDPAVSNARINNVYMAALGIGSVGDDYDSPGTISGNALSLFATGNNIGVPGNVLTSSPSITVAAYGNLLLESHYANTLTVNAGIANNRGVFNLTAAGNIEMNGAIVADSIFVDNSGSTGNITVSAPAIAQFAEFDTAGTFMSSSIIGGASQIIAIISPWIINNGTISTALSEGRTIFYSPNADGSIYVENNGIIRATAHSSVVRIDGGDGSMVIANNGIIDAAGTSGIIGFNSGPTGAITVTGTGSMSASQVNFGNLDFVTADILPPFVTVNPFAGHFSLGNISIDQSAITGTVQVSGTIQPPQPPVPHSASSQSPALLFWLMLNGLWQAEHLSAQSILNTQIGTRLATDYTPWTTYPMQPQSFNQFPLQGSVAVNALANQGEALFSASCFNANELTAMANQGILFGPQSTGSFLDLLKGHVLLMPTSDITVQTREGLVSIPKGAIAWIMETGSDVAVYDLHDSLQTGAIKVTVKGKKLNLSPGTQVLLSRNGTASFDTLNPGNAIAYRNVKVTDLGEGIKAYVCDFSIAHGLTNVPVIRNLLKSNDPAQRRAAMKLIKNATILADLTGVNYTTGSQPTTR